MKKSPVIHTHVVYLKIQSVIMYHTNTFYEKVDIQSCIHFITRWIFKYKRYDDVSHDYSQWQYPFIHILIEEKNIAIIGILCFANHTLDR
jgi:hypothetical protein